MKKSLPDLTERPAEFLRALEERSGAYRQLLDESGSLALACHRVATARCRSSSLATSIPSALEIGAAAFEIYARLGFTSAPPTSAALADECELAGVMVIRPMATKAAA